MKKLIISLNFLFLFLIIYSQNEINTNGYNIFRYGNGKISSEGYLVNGKPDKYWITYYPNGVIKSEGNRKYFLLDSVWIFYNDNGDTTEKINYFEGKKNGYHYMYYTDNSNKVKSKELYINNLKEGKSYYYYPDGSINKIINFKNNQRHGLGYEFINDSLIIGIYEFNNDRLVNYEMINRYDENNDKNGIWREFYNDFRIKTETVFINGVKEGLYKQFDKDGSLEITVLYKNDSIINDSYDMEDFIDFRKEFDEQGNLVFQGTFRNNFPIGIHRWYDSLGNVIKTELYDEFGRILSDGIINDEGNRQDQFINYYPYKKIKSRGKYINNRRVGTWIFYFSNGKIEQEGNYKNGRLDGLWKWYYPNGKILREEYYQDGKEDGPFVEYDSLGNIITKGNYIEGMKEGEWFYHVGDHTEIGKYTNDLKDGYWTYYFENGDTEFRGKFLRGLPDGKHKYYYENGEVKEEQLYSAGIKVKTWKYYDIGGNLILAINYKNGEEFKINGVRIN